MNLTFIYVLVGWIFSLCLHEWAHARVAYEGGDTSVKDKGYLSFNPFAYVHPLLSIVLPLVFLFMGGIGLPGGAVYIDESRLKNATWNSLVSLAGPAANLGLAIVIGLIFRIAPPPADAGGPALAFLGILQISAVLFNLIPLPPLDGYGILRPHLDNKTRSLFDSFSMMGMFVLFVLFSNVEPLNQAFWQLVYNIANILGIRWDYAARGQELFMFWRN